MNFQAPYWYLGRFPTGGAEFVNPMRVKRVAPDLAEGTVGLLYEDGEYRKYEMPDDLRKALTGEGSVQ